MLYQLSYLGTLVFRIVALRVIIIERHLSNSEQIRVSRLAYEPRVSWPVAMSFEPSETPFCSNRKLPSNFEAERLKLEYSP